MASQGPPLSRGHAEPRPGWWRLQGSGQTPVGVRGPRGRLPGHCASSLPAQGRLGSPWPLPGRLRRAGAVDRLTCAADPILESPPHSPPVSGGPEALPALPLAPGSENWGPTGFSCGPAQCHCPRPPSEPSRHPQTAFRGSSDTWGSSDSRAPAGLGGQRPSCPDALNSGPGRRAAMPRMTTRGRHRAGNALKSPTVHGPARLGRLGPGRRPLAVAAERGDRKAHGWGAAWSVGCTTCSGPGALGARGAGGAGACV